MESSHLALPDMRSAGNRTARGVLTALVVCLTIAAAGCGSKAKEPKAGSEAKSGTSQKSAARSEGGAGRETKSTGKTAGKTAPAAEKPAPRPVAAQPGGGHIRLVDRGCVSFEPHWSTIRVGQSLTWHSDLKKSVTIHVPAGAFERTEYVVPAKKSVHTGPAQAPGDHPMWAMPAACQAAPHGVQGAGPGVSVEGR